MHTRVRGAIAGIGIATLALAGAGSIGVGTASAAKSSAKKQTTYSFTLASGVTAAALDLTVAQKQGYFTKHHVKVTVKYTSSGSQTLAAITGGSIQAGESNIVSVMQAYDEGIKTACFAAHMEDGHYPLMASGNAGVSSLSQLAGKKIATGPSPITAAMVKQALLDKGVNPNSPVYDLTTPYNDEPAALSNGSDAAAVPPPPFNVEADASGGRVLIGDLQYTVVGDDPLTCWAAEPAWIKTHKVAIGDFLAALSQANKWIEVHPEQFFALAHTQLDLQTYLAKNLPITNYWTNTLTAADINKWAKLAQRWSLIPKPLPVSDIFIPVTAA